MEKIFCDACGVDVSEATHTEYEARFRGRADHPTKDLCEMCADKLEVVLKDFFKED